MDRQDVSESGGLLGRADVLAACMESGGPIRVRKIATPEWARKGMAEVAVRMLPASCIDAVQDLMLARSAKRLTDAELMARWCVLGICSEEGVPLFEESDVPVLLAGPLGPLHRCMLAIFELNRIYGDAEPKKAPAGGRKPAGSSTS